MHSKSNNIKLTTYNDKVVYELFESLRSRYQETSMEESEFLI